MHHHHDVCWWWDSEDDVRTAVVMMVITIVVVCRMAAVPATGVGLFSDGARRGGMVQGVVRVEGVGVCGTATQARPPRSRGRVGPTRTSSAESRTSLCGVNDDWVMGATGDDDSGDEEGASVQIACYIRQSLNSQTR